MSVTWHREFGALVYHAVTAGALADDYFIVAVCGRRTVRVATPRERVTQTCRRCEAILKPKAVAVEEPELFGEEEASRKPG